MLCRGRHAVNKYHWRLWGVLAVFRQQWVCPRSWSVCFPCLHCTGSRLLCRELSEAGPGLYALPRSELLRFNYLGSPQRCRLGWACILFPSQVRVAQATRCLASALSPGAVRLIASLVPAAGFPGWQWAHPLRCAVCIFWGADLWLQSSWRMLTIQNPRKSWLLEACLQFGRGCHL